jgi:hypothetical protein
MQGRVALWLLSAFAVGHALPTDAVQCLVLTSSDPTALLGTATLAVEYYGTYNSREPFAIYKTDLDSLSLLDAGSIVFTHEDSSSHSLVWFEQVITEGPLQDAEPDFTASLDSFINPQPIPEGQIALASRLTPHGKVLWQSSHGAIMSIPNEAVSTLDTMLPRLWEAVLIPSRPLPKPTLIEDESESDKRLRKILSKIYFNPDVSSVLSSISVAQMGFDVRYLTGEASDSSIVSRHSFSDGARVAAGWLKSKFQEFGAKCTFMHFFYGFAPNVICKYPARPMGQKLGGEGGPRVIIGAHYDSRGTFGR